MPTAPSEASSSPEPERASSACRPVLASSINKVVRIGDPFIRFRLSKEVEQQNIMAHAIDLGPLLGLVIGKKPR